MIETQMKPEKKPGKILLEYFNAFHSDKSPTDSMYAQKPENVMQPATGR